MLRKLLNIGVLSALVLSPLALAAGCASDSSDQPSARAGDGTSHNDSQQVIDEKGHERPDLEND